MNQKLKTKDSVSSLWDNFKHSKVMKSRNLQPRCLYPAKLSFRIEGQMKSSPSKKKLKEFIITKPLLYEMFKGLI